MAVREFTDAQGQRWRAWSITPEQLHPSTRDEDYMQDLLEGWLTFERAEGGEKRRLFPCPPDWERYSDDELRERLEMSEPVKSSFATPDRPPSDDVSRASQAAGEAARAATADQGPAPAPGIRTFHYPGGRLWTVYETRKEPPASGGQQGAGYTVLHFTAGARTLDLRTWPARWAEYTDEQLADLLYRAFPRDPRRKNLTTYHRRRGESEAPRQ